MRGYSIRKLPLFLALLLCLTYLSFRFVTQLSTHPFSFYHTCPSRLCGLKCSPSYPPSPTHFNFSQSHQIAQRIFPSKPAPDTWRQRNYVELIRLLDCQRAQGRLRTCTPKDQQIVLLGTVHFSRVLEGIFTRKATFPAGEAIWADALLWALNQLKHPYLVVDGLNHNETNTRLGHIHDLLGSNVKMVIGDYLSIPQCLKNAACAQSSKKPSGIPHHKLFIFDGFGQDVGHPLGRQWHLTFYPQEDKNFTYLGLTIEHYCRKFGVVPAHQRNNKIYILGKDRSYLHPPAPQLYSNSMWASITNATGVEFTMGTAQKHLDTQPPEPNEKNQLLEGITDIGSQSRDQFLDEIQHHRAVIGLGWPVQPSTPLEALCVGTPYINPVWVGRRSQSDRSKWHTQHPYLARFDPPHVYNVQDHREDDVLEAIKQIMKNPLTEPFIPEDMKKQNYLDRIDKLIQFNWANLAQTRTNLADTNIENL